MWSLLVFQFHYIGEYLMIVLAKLFYRCRPLTSQRFNAMQFSPAKLLQDRSVLSEHFIPCSGPVLGFSWYWIQICWNSVPGVTVNLPCDQAPGWMIDADTCNFTQTDYCNSRALRCAKNTTLVHIFQVNVSIRKQALRHDLLLYEPFGYLYCHFARQLCHLSHSMSILYIPYYTTQFGNLTGQFD